MDKLDIGLAHCYTAVYKNHTSNNLVITFTPTNGFFLYHNDLNAHKICISTHEPNYYLYNPGSSCKKIANYITKLGVTNVVLIGSSKAGLAALLWGELIYRNLSNKHNIFAISFSPQTLLYPFNERLYFPSYKVLMNLIRSNTGMKKCAENYGDINTLLSKSELEGLIIYPRLNPCDKAEAERVDAKNITLIGLDYPLHGSFLPFMQQAKDPQKLRKMVEKIYANSKKDEDITATIPESEQELYEIISSIQVPTIEELCRAIFFKMTYKNQIENYLNVKQLGLI